MPRSTENSVRYLVLYRIHKFVSVTEQLQVNRDLPLEESALAESTVRHPGQAHGLHSRQVLEADCPIPEAMLVHQSAGHR